MTCREMDRIIVSLSTQSASPPGAAEHIAAAGAPPCAKCNNAAANASPAFKTGTIMQLRQRGP